MNFIALSPRRRTDCGGSWTRARDTLIEDAEYLAAKRRDDAEQEMFAEAAEYMQQNWKIALYSERLDVGNAWGDRATFQIVCQRDITDEGVAV